MRARLRELDQEHDKLANTVHRDEMVRAEQRLRLEQFEERALDELGLDPEALVADYGPDQPSRLVADADGVPRRSSEPVPFVREEQEAAYAAPSACWRSSARSTRWRSRSSRRSRSGTGS